jgi:predicted metal-binding protein
VAECARFFAEYRRAAVFHFPKALKDPEERHAWSRQVNRELLELERAVFLKGHPRAFLLFMDSCGFCRQCAGSRAECKEPRAARPTPEAMAVDVFSTVRQAGYPIEVLPGYAETMNRYAFLMVEEKYHGGTEAKPGAAACRISWLGSRTRSGGATARPY